MKMNRKVRERLTQLCVICGDVAKGINFNALTCTSCKAFFRRHADGTKKIVCSFDDNCHVNQVTRKFCTKCRLKKCFSAGMKKQLIIRNEDELVKKSKMVPSHLSKQNIFEKTDLYRKELMHEFQIVFDAETCTNSSYSSTTFDDSVTNETLNTTFEYDSSSPSVDFTIDSSTWNPSVLESDIVHRQSTELGTISTTELAKLMTLSLSTLEDYCTELLTNLNDDSIDKLLIDTEAMNQDNTSSIEAEGNLDANYSDIQGYNPMIEQPTQIRHENKNIQNIKIFNRELLQPELYLLKELSDACLLLHNPYRRMVQQSNCDHVRCSRMPQYFLHRLVRMSKRLHRFTMQFTSQQQAQILKKSLLEMFCIRSVLKYNPNRDSWGLIDDMAKVSVLVPTEMIQPFCSEQRYQRHKSFPKLFRDEWKRDKTIFDLLVSIILFTPRPNDHYCLEEEYARYTNLLRRYLEMKYPTLQEAMECFNQLLYNIDEMRQLSEDVYKLFRSYSHMLNDCPFLIELLECDQVQALNDNTHNRRDAKKLTTTIEISH